MTIAIAELKEIKSDNTLGSEEYAQVIANVNISGIYDENYRLPNDFTFLGKGSYRYAFRGPDGLVYKKDREDTVTENSGNVAEAYKFSELSDMDWIPKFRLFENGILVMPYLENLNYTTLSDEEENRIREIGRTVVDGFSRNIGRDPKTKKIYLRDGGGYAF